MFYNVVCAKYGYINLTGEEVIYFCYEDAHDFNEGLTAVKKYGKWGLYRHV